jgi:hypothetical protein
MNVESIAAEQSATKKPVGADNQPARITKKSDKHGRITSDDHLGRPAKVMTGLYNTRRDRGDFIPGSENTSSFQPENSWLVV